MSDPGLLGPAVRRELERYGGAGEMADVVAAWPTAVGAELARQAWPARRGRDGTLHVATSSSTWAFELRHLEAMILARLADSLGERAPARLRFAAGPVPEAGLDEQPARERRRRTEPSAEEQARAAELAAEISDDGLRSLVARAAAASLAQPPSGEPV